MLTIYANATFYKVRKGSVLFNSGGALIDTYKSTERYMYIPWAAIVSINSDDLDAYNDHGLFQSPKFI